MNNGVASQSRKSDAGHLAPREAEILGLLADGKPSKVIAFELSLSPETVRYYIKRIYRALGVHNRAQAVAHALGDPRLTHPKTIGSGQELPALKPTEIVGRQVELTELLGALEVNRLVTATGIGGNGKTTLAHAAYDALRSERSSTWVALKGGSADDAVHRIASAFGLELRTTDETAWTELGARIEGSHDFLVLDNFEHLVAHGTRISELLACVPGITILVTSRIPIGLEGELVYPVKGLSLTATGSTGLSKAADLFFWNMSLAGSWAECPTRMIRKQFTKFARGWEAPR